MTIIRGGVGKMTYNNRGLSALEAQPSELEQEFISAHLFYLSISSWLVILLLYVTVILASDNLFPAIISSRIID
jgi:hypothetical protein